MAWITPPVFVALQTLTDSVMNELSSRLSDLWTATTIGDTQYASATDTLSRRAIGSTGQYYGVTGGVPVWKNDGVPGLFTTAGDLTYGTGANASARLGIGSAGKILTVNSGATAPEWANRSVCELQLSGDQDIVNSTYTNLSFATENYDTDAYHAGGSPTRITIPAGWPDMWYLISAQVPWEENATNIREALIYLNGTSTFAKASLLAVANARTEIRFSLPFKLSASDYIELRVWQNSGANLNVEAAPSGASNPGTYFNLLRLGP